MQSGTRKLKFWSPAIFFYNIVKVVFTICDPDLQNNLESTFAYPFELFLSVHIKNIHFIFFPCKKCAQVQNCFSCTDSLLRTNTVHTYKQHSAHQPSMSMGMSIEFEYEYIL